MDHLGYKLMLRQLAVPAAILISVLLDGITGYWQYYIKCNIHAYNMYISKEHLLNICHNALN